MKRNPEVTAYLTYVAPPTQRAILRRMRAAIRKALPQAEECFESKMPVYKVNGQWAAGFAARSKCPMLYVMDSELLDQHAERLGRLRSGKSCLDLRETKALPLAELEKLAVELVRELGRRHALLIS